MNVLPHFIKVYPHELKRVLGVPRVQAQYAGAAVAALEVQHG
jgi:hypothetical protein